MSCEEKLSILRLCKQQECPEYIICVRGRGCKTDRLFYTMEGKMKCKIESSIVEKFRNDHNLLVDEVNLVEHFATIQEISLLDAAKELELVEESNEGH